MSDAIAVFFLQQVESATTPLKAKIEELETTNKQLKAEAVNLHETIEYCTGTKKLLSESNGELTEKLRVSAETLEFFQKQNTDLTNEMEELRSQKKMKVTPVVSEEQLIGLKVKTYVAEERARIVESGASRLTKYVQTHGKTTDKELKKLNEDAASGVFTAMFTGVATDSEGEEPSP